MNLVECFVKLSKIEEDSSILYKEFSEICSERFKHIGINFSKEEEKHREFILRLSSNISFKEIQVDENLNDIFEEQLDYLNFEDKNAILTSEKSFFIFALQMEKNSIEIYTKLLRTFEKDLEEYKIFKTLLNEEKKHMIYILDELYKLN